MPSFEVADTQSFPVQVLGIVVPDDGHKIYLHEGIENYYNPDEPTPVIALFVSESMTDLGASYLDNPDMIDLRAIITFGRRSKYNKNSLGRESTHLKIKATELRVPFMRLMVPDSYPALINPLDTEDPYFKTWVDKNPLKNLYHKNVTVSFDGTTATFHAVDQ